MLSPLACDRCGANPYPHGYRAINKDGRVLDLCLHHFNEHATALTRQGWTIVPVSVLIEDQPATQEAVS